MLPRFGRFRLDAIASGRRGAFWLGQTIEQLDDLAQTIEVEQVLGCQRQSGWTLERRRVVRAAQCDGGVTPVREHDDKVRIVPSANSNDLDALTPKGMMRMGDGDKSRRRSG
jgi:hypothetical protein